MAICASLVQSLTIMEYQHMYVTIDVIFKWHDEVGFYECNI